MSDANMTGAFVVANDVSIRDVGNTKVVNIPVVQFEKIGKDPDAKELVSYFDFELWDKAAEYVYNNVKKGDTFVVLSSVPRQSRWEKDGKAMSKVFFRIQAFRHIPKKSKTE
jgi:single-stranded DNA-binding protein